MGTQFHWAGYCISLCLSVLVCEMGPMHSPARRSCREGQVRWYVGGSGHAVLGRCGWYILLVVFPHFPGLPGASPGRRGCAGWLGWS